MYRRCAILRLFPVTVWFSKQYRTVRGQKIFPSCTMAAERIYSGLNTGGWNFGGQSSLAANNQYWMVRVEFAAAIN